MELTIGSRVKICSKEKLDKTCECFGVCDKMYKYCDQLARVAYIDYSSRHNILGFNGVIYYLDIDHGAYLWANLQLTPVEMANGVSIF